jgi:hypothetical protein
MECRKNSPEKQEEQTKKKKKKGCIVGKSHSCNCLLTTIRKDFKNPIQRINDLSPLEIYLRWWSEGGICLGFLS